MKSIYTSLAAFQQEVPAIYKGTSGYGYKYADLNEILDKINPLLKKNGLGFTQLLDGTKLKTVIFHSESGESIEGSVEIPQNVQLKGMNDFQVLGSAITYLRRYSLSAALGLVTDSDNDAQGVQKPRISSEKRDLILKVGKEKGLSEKALEARINALQNDTEADAAIQSLLLLGRD